MKAADNVRIIKGSKELRLELPDEIPELDDEQVVSGAAMFEDCDKLLLSDPGAGKTLTALDAMIRLEEATANMGEGYVPRFLIVCPNIAVYTWMTWVARVYTECGVSALIQYVDNGKRAIDPDATHVIMTYGLLSRDNHALFKEVRDAKFECAIFDESDNLAGLDSKRTKVVFGEKFENTGLLENIPYCWFLTGTPIPRYNDGLYPVLRAIFPHRLEEFHAKEKANFLATFCQTERVRYGNMRIAKEVISGSRNERKLNELLYGGQRPIAIRNKLIIRDEPVHKVVSFDPKFSKEFLELEEAVVDNPGMYDGDRVVDPRQAKAMAMLGEELAPYVVDYVNGLLEYKRERGDKTGIVLLHWHRSVGAVLAEELERRWNVSQINGGTDSKHDNKVEREFNAGRLDVVVGQIRSMGVALNLQGNCNTVVFAEETFSHATNLQAYQRVWRRGQDKVVTVHWCRTFSPLSDMKVRTAGKKRESAAIALDGGK